MNNDDLNCYFQIFRLIQNTLTRMKNILYAIILSFLFSSSVFADLESVVDAYEAGDYETVYREIKLFAERGEPHAQRILGLMYKYGQGVTQDNKEALKWLRLAAEQGEAEAQFHLGLMYGIGEGVTKDYKEALKWFRLAAEQGDGGAQYSLGVMHAKGHGVTQDYKKAEKWLRLAAEKGVSLAQFNLGWMYANGEGVIQNVVIAHMWYNIAARDGNEDVKKSRDIVIKQMTSEQIAEAQELARECIKKNYKDCG